MEKKKEVKETEKSQSKSKEVAKEVVEEPTDQENNWKRFREKQAQDRATSKEALEKAEREASLLKKAVADLVNKAPDSGDNFDTGEEETEDQRIDRKAKAAFEKLEHQNFPTQLRQAFPDFDEVCSPENMDYLTFHDPEYAKAVRHMPDGFEKWASVHAKIKEKLPNVNAAKEKTMMQANSSKPQSPSAPGVGNLGAEASLRFLSEDRKAENWKRMQQNMK